MNCKNKKCGKPLQADFKFCPFCGKDQTSAVKKSGRRANGTGSIYSRKDIKNKPWAASSTITGKRVYLGNFTTKTEALRALQEYEYNPVNCFNITLNELHNKWIKTKAYNKLSQSSKQGYKSAWSKLTSLYNRKFRDLRTSDFQAVSDFYENPHQEIGTNGKLKYIDKKGKGTYTVTDKPKMSDGLGYSALHNLKCLLTNMYTFAMKEDIVNKNYATFIELPEKEEVSSTRFTDIQLEQIRQNIDKIPYMDYIYAMCYLNFRVSEFLELTPDNYIITETSVPVLIGGKKTEAGRNRIIPVHPKVEAIVKKCVDRTVQNGRATIFHRLKDGSQMNKDYFLKYCFRPAMKEIGFSDKYTPHSCRRTFSTRMSAAGASQEDIIALMGHSSFDIDIKHYIIQEVDTLYNAIKKMA